MRRFVPVAVVSAAVALVAVSATAALASSHSQATGTGTLDQFGNPTAHVNAVQTKPGLKGSFTITYPDGTSVSGTPSCLSVSGDTAYVIGRIDESTGPRREPNNWQPGNYVVIGVQDSGEPGTKGPDHLNFSAGFASQPACGPNSAATPVFAIVEGNYRVSD
jgi:hypothetical protein